MRTNTRSYWIIGLITGIVSCTERLNYLYSEGTVLYKNDVVDCLYFETKKELSPFINSLIENFGEVNYSEPNYGLIVGWNDINSNWGVIDLELRIKNINDSENPSDNSVDRTLVTIVVFDSKGNNLTQSGVVSDELQDFFKDKINKTLN